jgi:ABC-type multidrug transport system fused ATPase/permease subunit
MDQQKSFSFNSGGNPLGTIVGLALLIGVFYLLFRLTAFIFRILWIASPFLLIATLIINRKVVTDYIRLISSLFKRSPLWGGAGIAFTVIAFPLVSVYLFGKAMMIKRAKEAQEYVDNNTYSEADTGRAAYRDSDLVDYEELESRPLDLPAPQRPSPPPPSDGGGNDSKYDDLFKS